MSEQQVLRNFLERSQNILSEPESIEPLELARYFHAYLNYGVHDHITCLVQRYFYANLNHPQLIRFIRLIDQLIRISYPLPNNFPDMFIKCFWSCHQRGQKNLLDELTILRKMWHPIILPQTLVYMREQVYHFTQIDLDSALREETRSFLKKYFDKNFRLTEYQLSEIIDAKFPFYREPLNPKRQSLSNIKQHPRQWTHGKKKTKVDYDYSNNSCLTQPEQPKEQTRQEKVFNMLRRLQEMINFRCNLCGKRFSVEERLKKHQVQHFQEQMKAYVLRNMSEGLKRLKTTRAEKKLEKSVKQFIAQNTYLHRDQTYIAVKQNTKKQDENTTFEKVCYFCRRDFELSFRDDMIYEKAIKVRVSKSCFEETDGEIHLMHVSCYQNLTEQH